MTCDDCGMWFRNFLTRAVAILLIGSLFCAPMAVSAAGTGAIADDGAMSSEMPMDSTAAAADEMPCHKNMPDQQHPCPFMAVCMALCCQGIPISAISFAPPAFVALRMLPPKLAQLDGVNFPPPSRPPKA
jgi:hypothetical protein